MITVSQIHILHIVPQLGLGGIELALARVIATPQLAAMRHSVISMRGLECSDAFQPDVKIYHVQSRPNELLLPIRLAKLIRQIGPDLIHARNWGAWPDAVMARTLLCHRVPLVYSFHGLAEPHQPLRRRLAGRLMASCTKRIFTVSPPSRDLLAQSLWLSPRRIYIIPNGVDSGRFSPGLACPPRQRLVIGCVGNLTRVKNHQLLIAGFVQAIASGADAELRIAGNGPLLGEVQLQIHELGMEDRVKLLGYVTDTVAFLRQLDVFALCSLSEAHPNALLEAMACGLPCVATGVGGVPEVLEDGRCGIVVTHDPAVVGGALSRLLKDSHLRQELGHAARQRVVEHYSLKQMAQAYEQMYRTLVT